MKPEEIYSKLKSQFDEAVPSIEEIPIEPFIKIVPESIAEVAKYLKDEPELTFDMLMCLSGVDGDETLTVVYHLFSIEHHHKIVLKVDVPKSAPNVPTVENVWKTANWHEREAFDLLGIIFDNHSDFRRILLPDDWEGHPLRKDYEPPKFYDGMPVAYEERKTL